MSAGIITAARAFVSGSNITTNMDVLAIDIDRHYKGI
jgi:hypothetical protein